jgi:signal transduction histidine kinase
VSELLRAGKLAPSLAPGPAHQDEVDHLKRRFRDLVALSTLPAMWSGARPTRIAESLAASLFTTLDPVYVYIGFTPVCGELDVGVVQTSRYQIDPALAASCGPAISAWARTHDPDEPMMATAPGTGERVRVFTRPIGLEARLGVIGVALPPARTFGPLNDVVMNVAATQAAIAVENARLLHSLKEADRRKDEFLATLSHELRNPLAPLRNSLHLLRMAGLDPKSSAVQQMMERQVNHMVRLVDDLLEVSRISRGTLELRRERVELAAIVRSAVETSQPLIDEAGHRLTLQLPDEPVWIDGDLVRLSQLLANLLNNAAKYTSPGGEIALEASADAGWATISVRDNGAGIAPESLSRIFEMFSRGEAAQESWKGGLGIGLALARKLARMHGGDVVARSAGEGQGSEFTVRLPLSQPSAGLAAASPGAPPAVKMGILVVDDNVDAGESLAMILGLLGAQVRVAHNGYQAIEVLRIFPARVVLLDIGMPGIDGYETARRIRAQFPAHAPTIVALSGWGQEEDRVRAREAGIDHHLIKPAEIGALQALLRSLEPEAA